MKLSIIIVNYNVKYYLYQCLDSVRKAIKGIDAEVIVVDNHSQDGSLEYLKPFYPEVMFIASNHNVGFARANNIGIMRCKGEYVLLLNPDTVVGENTLSECISFMDAHENAGALGVRMLKADGTIAKESRRGIPYPMTAFYKMTGLCDRFPNNRRFSHYYMSYLPWDEASQIEVVSGAFCFLRKKALDSVGLIDEDYFMYGEDIDLSFRLLKKGWENWYLPVNILHYKGESTERSSFRYVHVFYDAMLIFLRKHYGWRSFWISIPVKCAIYLKASLELFKLGIKRMRKMLGFTHLIVPKGKKRFVTFNTSEKSYEMILNEMYSSPEEKDTEFVIYHPQANISISLDRVIDQQR